MTACIGLFALSMWSNSPVRYPFHSIPFFFHRFFVLVLLSIIFVSPKWRREFSLLFPIVYNNANGHEQNIHLCCKYRNTNQYVINVSESLVNLSERRAYIGITLADSTLSVLRNWLEIISHFI